MRGKSLKFHIITDLHLRARTLPPIKNRRDQLCINDSSEIIRALVHRLKSDKDIDLILFAGDLTQEGDRESFEEMYELLEDLKSSGKRLVVLPASHDYDSGEMSRDEVNFLYRPFIKDKIISFSPDGYSYVAKLKDGYRLLCLSVDELFYSEDTVKWGVKEIAKAKRTGEYIFGMQHYPYLLPTPLYPLFAGRDMPKNYKEVGEAFADAGLSVMFCGHSHMHTVTQSVTKKGNRYYSVCTSALTGYPAYWRAVEIRRDGMKIITQSFTATELLAAGVQLKNKSPEQYTLDQFKQFLEEIFYGAAYDIELLAKNVATFSVPREKVIKNKRLIRLAGKFLYKKTLGTLSRLFFYAGKIDKAAKKKILKDLIIDLICYTFRGDAPYTPETSTYKAVELLFKRISPIVRLFDKEREIAKIFDSVLRRGVLYNPGPPDLNLFILNDKTL